VRRLFLLFAIILIACQAVSSLSTLPTIDTRPSPTASPVTPQPTLTPTHTLTPTPPIPEEGFSVRLHPDGPLYVGDQVSVEVISPEDSDLEEKKVQIQVDGLASNDLGSSGFGEYGIGGRLQATFNWVWDTSDLESGDYHIEFSVQPGGPEWTETISLLPSVDVPNPEPKAHWETIVIECCEVHFISGTDFAQALPDLLDLIQVQAEDAVQRMGLEFEQRVPITILPRVLGHGGFAGSEIYVSYIDDNYAGNDLSQVLLHEMIHILDRQMGGELRPSLFVEGLAAYLSDGHFKKEPLLQRAAALLKHGWYLPLNDLADSFYKSQHEIGYLEGAALVQFMVNGYGWQAFNDFYRDINPHPSGDQSQAIDQALQKHFGLTLEQLEMKFKTDLHRQNINPDMYDDVILSVTYYEAVRRYQRMLDPSAYFLTAWLPEGGQMRQRGIVADYLRRPSTPDNRVIEELLVDIDLHIRAGNYLAAEKELKLVEQKLDLIENDVLIGTFQPEEAQKSGLGFD
jgi:hypothetical protein